MNTTASPHEHVMAQWLKHWFKIFEFVDSNLMVVPFIFEMFMQIKYIVC